MQFCKKCGTMLFPKKKEPAIICANCSTKNVLKEEMKFTQKVEKQAQVEVVDESQEDSTLPTCEFSCDKCSSTLAYYWLQQTRASDEPETKFLKCTKCKHIIREYQ